MKNYSDISCPSPSLRGRAGVGLLGLLCLLLCGCLTDFEPKDIDDVGDILVVEGTITDDETTITLTRSVNLMDISSNPVYVPNAKVYVECDDGTQFHVYNWNGQYKIKTGKLNPDLKYSLKIEIEECEHFDDRISLGMPCTSKTYVYGTEPSYPIQTPEIDSIFWTKRGMGQPVNIHVATHSPYDEILYYRWWFKEDWEINSPVALDDYPSNCWNYSISSEIFLGSAEKTIFGKITDNIKEIPTWNKKLSGLYRIIVWQNAISKNAYDYFTNIKKNAETMGTIFAPIPSEIRGNISCITDPERHVIGFVEVTSTKTGQRYIYSREVYERPSGECPFKKLLEIDKGERYDWIQVSKDEDSYVHRSCVDCTYNGANTNKPDNWPR